MNRVYLGLGTNIEPRKSHLEKALEQLKQNEAITIVKQSNRYETAPVGYTEQADFLNMVVEIKTTLSPELLLDRCQTIEKELGRERTIRFGPRTIDLDILLYNEENIKTERLTVPHPRMHERGFVLIPLAEIAPHIKIGEETIDKLLNKLPKQERDDVKVWQQ
ncbi:MAG TPA: 2-amino-4-hydroxy-6-hydroxymethyldihydropteridine diphosphokinase [Cerasibacillus sp.]|uniref:2-amino-4-hydroxy-6- hydroxymethyldihydropteridine diphosphokinase n=1 Tax=Cerasibacillus sp. TaxID=2498711 RepID=UPI002F3E5D46